MSGNVVMVVMVVMVGMVGMVVMFVMIGMVGMVHMVVIDSALAAVILIANSRLQSMSSSRS